MSTPNDTDYIMRHCYDVALVDAETCAAIGMVSLSWWFKEVHEGRAPKPVVKTVNMTRYRLADVREFWRKFADGNPEESGKTGRHKTTTQSASNRRRVVRASRSGRGPTVLTNEAVYSKYVEMTSATPKRMATRVTVANELGAPYALVDDHTRRLIREGRLRRISPGVFAPNLSAPAPKETAP